MLGIGIFTRIIDIPVGSDYVFIIVSACQLPSFLVCAKLKKEGVTRIFSREDFDEEKKFPSMENLMARLTHPISCNARVCIIGSLSSPRRIKKNHALIEKVEFENYD